MNDFSKLKKLIDICLAKGIPFVSYRLPQSNDIYTIVQHISEPKTLDNSTLIAEKSGFVFAPFLENNEHKRLLIESDVTIVNDNYSQALLIELENYSSKIENVYSTNVETTSFETYTKNVSLAIQSIENKEFEKVVISKTKVEPLSENFDVSALFSNLLNNYADALVYVFQFSKQHCWMGASPEPLLINEGTQFSTVSLAGTQVATNNFTPIWSEKEIREQAIVSQYISNELNKCNVSLLNISETESFRAGNLIHLLTKFSFQSTMTIDAFIKALHPTPSIAGMEKQNAIEFIVANEKHNRSYYSGYLGMLNINEKSNIYVNLRCMQLFNTHCVLYAGAGITANSDPEKEWHETENKLLTLRRFLVECK